MPRLRCLPYLNRRWPHCRNSRLLMMPLREFGNLKKQQSATYLLRADKPSLYQLQSTGLLATAGNLRSRTNPSFVRKAQNGVGRNFSLQQYLREGDYQTNRADGRRIRRSLWFGAGPHSHSQRRIPDQQDTGACDTRSGPSDCLLLQNHDSRRFPCTRFGRRARFPLPP